MEFLNNFRKKETFTIKEFIERCDSDNNSEKNSEYSNNLFNNLTENIDLKKVTFLSLTLLLFPNLVSANSECVNTFAYTEKPLNTTAFNTNMLQDTVNWFTYLILPLCPVCLLDRLSIKSRLSKKK